MDPFTFWGLPFLARKNVFRQISPNDVFNLSMTSMKSKLFTMTYHKLPPANFSWHIGRDQGNFWNGTCAVWRVEDEMQLYIRFVDPNINGINVFVQDLREGKSLENPSLRNVNMTSILMSQDPDGIFWILLMLKASTFAIAIMMTYPWKSSSNASCLIRKFRDVTILNHLQKLKAREFDFLMNEIETDEMKLNTIGRVKGVFTHPKMEFGRHSAVSFDNILNIQSQNFESRMDRLLKPSECVQLLVAWSNGEKLQNLKKLIIHHDYKLEDKHLIKKIKKRIRELEGEVPFEVMEPEQESSDEEEEGGDGGEEEDISEESEQDDDEMVDEEQDVDEEEDNEEVTGEQEEDRVAEEAVEKSVESESDDEENGTDKDVEGGESDTEEEEDSDEEPETDSDSEDEVEESDNDESDADEMEDDDQDDNDNEEEEDLLRIKRRSDGNVLRLQTHYGSFEIEDETAREERLKKFF